MGIRNKVSKTIDNVVEYYLKNYRKMIFIPIIFVIFFASFIGYYYHVHGQIVNEGISLAGGTNIVISTNQSISPTLIASSLGTDLKQSVTVSVVKAPFTNTITGYSITVGKNVNTTLLENSISSILKIPVNSKDSSVDFVSATLAQSSLYSSLILLGIAFVLVAAVSLFYFRSMWQAFSNVISIISDVINIVGVLDIIGFSFSTASIAGILMIMGYSADRNIILATNILKREEASMHYRLAKTIKTSLTMDAAALVTFLILFLGTTNSTLHEIAIILIIGVIFDDFTVWILNGSTQLYGLKFKEVEKQVAKV
jgi:preprotein translocase subunit SecF